MPGSQWGAGIPAGLLIERGTAPADVQIDLAASRPVGEALS